MVSQWPNMKPETNFSSFWCVIKINCAISESGVLCDLGRKWEFVGSMFCLGK